MRILISNDDGIYSPGLAALADVAAKFGDVRIVAPDVEQSSSSHSITAGRPLSYRPTPNLRYEAYRVNGTPADCVALGIHHWKDIDLVLSGINLGVNLGNSVWHSGTLAAAKQAALTGIRGIAFSTPVNESEPDFSAVTPWVEEALKHLLPLRDLPLINVNIPPQATGLCWTKQSLRHYDGRIVPQVDPAGRQQFWVTFVPVEQIEEGTDRWAMQQGLVSLTPLRLDLTDEAQLARARSLEGCNPAGVSRSAPAASSSAPV